MTALKTKFLKYIDSVTNEEHLYEVIPPAPTETERGGIIASPKTDLETAEAKLGEDGKLYVNASVQIPADWNQNDSTAQDYVKNRTHWAEIETTCVLEDAEYTLEDFNGTPAALLPVIDSYVIGKTYKIKINDVEYSSVATDLSSYAPAPDMIGFGNLSLFGINEGGENIPYLYYNSCIMGIGVIGFVSAEFSVGNVVTISVSKIEETVHKLDEKYLPEPTADDALALLMEVGMVEPITDEDGIITDETNVIYTF